MALERDAASLAALGPQATLDRGYAIVKRDSDGAVIRHPGDAASGELLSIRVARGELTARVEEGGPQHAKP